MSIVSNDYLPSRIDFAKQRFGGPFTTEQVENVKTFLRIVIVLLAAGQLFVLEVPLSPFIFPFFGLHTLHYHQKLGIDICTADVMMMEAGSVLSIFFCTSYLPSISGDSRKSLWVGHFKSAAGSSHELKSQWSRTRCRISLLNQQYYYDKLTLVQELVFLRNISAKTWIYVQCFIFSLFTVSSSRAVLYTQCTCTCMYII